MNTVLPSPTNQAATAAQPPGEGRGEGRRWGCGCGEESGAQRAGPTRLLCRRVDARTPATREHLRNIDLSPPFRDLDREISIFCVGSKKQKRPGSCFARSARVLLPNGWRKGLGRARLRPAARGSHERPCAQALAWGRRGCSRGARLSREADCGGGKGFQSPLSCESHVTSLPCERTVQGPRTLRPGSPRAEEGGARSRYDQGAGWEP